MKKSNRTRILALFMSVLLVASLFAGCGTPKESAKEETKAKTAEAAKETSKEEKKISGEIEYTSLWKEGEPAAAWLKETCAAFEKDTGVKVKLTLVGRDVLTKIKSRIIMKSPPDIIDQDGSELSAALWNKDILVTPLNEMFKEKGPEGQASMMDIMSENIIKLYEKDGNLYFFPYMYITSGFMYDKKMFADNGITVPKTWDEFIKMGEALKAKEIAPLALDGNINFYNAYYYYWALERVMGAGNLKKAALDATGAAWDDPGYLQAAKLVAELSKTSKNFFQKGYEGSNYPAAQADWALGKSGCILCGTWIPVETSKQAKQGFDYGFFPFPAVDGGKGKTTDVEAYLIGCAIPAGAKNPDAAKALIKYLVKKEVAQKFADITLNISVRKDIDYPKILADIKPFVESASSFHKSYDGVMSDVPEWFANVFYPLDNKLVFGQITAEDFIKQVKQKSIDYYKNKK